MTIAQETKALTPWATAVAREVRKMLAAREIPVVALDGLAGRNRMYWSRRIKNPTVALDIDDLAILAQRFDREITSFFPITPGSSDYKAMVPRPVVQIGGRPRGRRDKRGPARRKAA